MPCETHCGYFLLIPHGHEVKKMLKQRCVVLLYYSMCFGHSFFGQDQMNQTSNHLPNKVMFWSLVPAVCIRLHRTLTDTSTVGNTALLHIYHKAFQIHHKSINHSGGPLKSRVGKKRSVKYTCNEGEEEHVSCNLRRAAAAGPAKLWRSHPRRPLYTFTITAGLRRPENLTALPLQ